MKRKIPKLSNIWEEKAFSYLEKSKPATSLNTTRKQLNLGVEKTKYPTIFRK